MYVGLVDNDAMALSALRALLDKESEIEVIWDVADGFSAVAECENPSSDRPNVDVVLVDMDMPELDGAETIQRIQNLENPPKCVVFSVLDSFEQVKSAFQAGATGYLFKDDNPSFIAKALKRAYSGEMVFSAGCSKELIHLLISVDHPKTISGRKQKKGKPLLTARETQILNFVADSYSNDEIARKVGISVETVKTHIKAVIAKLGALNRAGAVAEGFRRGILL